MQDFIFSSLFFFNDTATTEIYTLSLHDALPISREGGSPPQPLSLPRRSPRPRDRKSTRLNSSHMSTSYAVFCLKKKKHLSLAERSAILAIVDDDAEPAGLAS